MVSARNRKRRGRSSAMLARSEGNRPLEIEASVVYSDCTRELFALTTRTMSSSDAVAGNARAVGAVVY
jgi:hypothetical protein